MAYRDASKRPQELAGATGTHPVRPPLTKSTYWTGYTVLFILPLLLACVLFFDALAALDRAAAGPLFVAALGLFLAPTFGLLAFRIYARTAGKTWSKQNNIAVRLLGEGQPDKALPVLDEILAKSRLFPVAYSLYLWNRGIALTRLGRFSEARATVASVHAANWFKRPRFDHFIPAVMISLGTIEALEGNLDVAERWQREAHSRLTSTSGISALPLGVLIAVRRGDADRAEALCESQWTAAEAALTARDVKLLRVLRAFVATRRASADRRVVDQWLVGARPIPPGMFDYVGTAWPEFESFARAELQS